MWDVSILSSIRTSFAAVTAHRAGLCDSTENGGFLTVMQAASPSEEVLGAIWCVLWLEWPLRCFVVLVDFCE